MRALAKCYYDTRAHQLHEQQVAIMAKDAHHSGTVITLFDFTCTPAQISIQPFPGSPLADTLDGLSPEWSNIVARAVSSRGRLNLHVLLVPQGPVRRFWVVPLRTSSSRIYDALLQLAMNLPEDCDEKYIADAVGKIRDPWDLETEGLIEVH